MDRRYSLGAVKDPEDPRDFLQVRLQAPIQLPNVVDYEAEVTPAKDQGERGACVGFAVVGVKEWQERRQRKWARADFDFSEEWIYSQIQLPGGGAYIRDGMRALKHTGLPRERFMPYRRDIRDNQPPAFNPTGHAKHNASFYRGGLYARLLTVQDMMQSLHQNGPFVLGIDWQVNWFEPRGVLGDGYPLLDERGRGSAGGHAVAVIGYNRGRGVFKFKNSWGPQWGRKGYAFIPIDTVSRFLLDAWATFDEAAVTNQQALATAKAYDSRLI